MGSLECQILRGRISDDLRSHKLETHKKQSEVQLLQQKIHELEADKKVWRDLSRCCKRSWNS